MKNILRLITEQATVAKPVQWLKKRYPSLYRFIAGRLRWNRFAGLPLTMLAILLSVNAMLFSEIAENIVNSEPMIQIDQQVTLYLFQRRDSTISQVLLGLTNLASQLGSSGVAAAIALGLLWKRDYRLALSLATVMTGMGICVYTGKQFFHRVRPLNVAYQPVASFSFPSGHSMDLWLT